MRPPTVPSLLLIAVIVTLRAEASEHRPPAALSVEEAAERAERHSALVAASLARQDAARAAASEASSTRHPRVDLSAAYSRLSEVPELRITGPDFEIRSIFPNIPDRYAARLSFAVPLYAGGGIAAGVEAAGAEVRAAGGETETARWDVRLEATRSWWTLVTAREAARVLGDAMASFERHLADARNREDLGLSARNETLAVQVERDRAELALVRATFVAARAEADLARLCGFDPGISIEPTPVPEPSPILAEPLEAMVERALDSRTERGTLSDLVDALRARARVARARGLPSITAEGGYDYSNPNLRVLPLDEAWRDTWDLSLRFRWTLWQGRAQTHAEAGAVAEAESISRRLEDLDRRIRFEVTSRALEVREAARALPVADRAVEAARESERIARDRYREGLLPSAELLDAETARLQAGLDRTEAVARLAVARALLERAIGGPAP